MYAVPHPRCPSYNFLHRYLKTSLSQTRTRYCTGNPQPTAHPTCQAPIRATWAQLGHLQDLGSLIVKVRSLVPCSSRYSARHLHVMRVSWAPLRQPAGPVISVECPPFPHTEEDNRCTYPVSQGKAVAWNQVADVLMYCSSAAAAHLGWPQCRHRTPWCSAGQS